MTTMRILILAAACVGAGPVAAQSADPAASEPAARNKAIVYKCTGADGGVIFSQDPCSTDPRKVQEVDTSGSLRTGSGGHTGEIAASVADSDCRSRARQTAYANTTVEVEESNRHIAEYQQRQSSLASTNGYAIDSAGNYIDDAANKKAIDELGAAIQREREFQDKGNANAEGAYRAALAACDAELAKQSQPPPDAAKH